MSQNRNNYQRRQQQTEQPESTQPASAVRKVSIEIEIGDGVLSGYCSPHLDTRFTGEEYRIMRAVLSGMIANGVVNGSGRRVETISDAFRVIVGRVKGAWR